MHSLFFDKYKCIFLAVWKCFLIVSWVWVIYVFLLSVCGVPSSCLMPHFKRFNNNRCQFLDARFLGGMLSLDLSSLTTECTLYLDLIF